MNKLMCVQRLFVFSGELLCCLYHSSILSQQTFPQEVLDLERSVRTLDLTHNKLGNAFCLWIPWTLYLILLDLYPPCKLIHRPPYCFYSWDSFWDWNINEHATPGKYHILCFWALSNNQLFLEICPESLFDLGFITFLLHAGLSW